MSLPSLKQYHTGKTVLVTGGNSGIGYAIARGFVTASAKRVIILGRRPDVVKSAATKLAEEAKQLRSLTVVEGCVCDISSLASTEDLWAGLQRDNIVIDVLVLNAAAGGASAPIIQSGRDKVWADFETSVRSALDFTERLWKGGRFAQVSYMWSTMAPERPSYGLTKSASTLLLQQIAKDTAVEDMQVVSFHPGGVLTDMARKAGYNEHMGIHFDDENLAGHFAVWAANRKAEFLHGRFVWANWDVDEIQTGDVWKQIRENPHFLKVGIEGLTESTGNSLRFQK